jgi:hypothetical protein
MADGDEGDKHHKRAGAQDIVKVVGGLPAEEFESYETTKYRRRKPAALPQKLSNLRQTLGVKLHTSISPHHRRKDNQFRHGRYECFNNQEKPCRFCRAKSAFDCRRRTNDSNQL